MGDPCPDPDPHSQDVGAPRRADGPQPGPEVVRTSLPSCTWRVPTHVPSLDALEALALNYTDHLPDKVGVRGGAGGTGATCVDTHLRAQDPGMWKKGGCCGTHRSGRRHYRSAGRQQG